MFKVMFELYIYLLIKWVKFHGSVCCFFRSNVSVAWSALGSLFRWGVVLSAGCSLLNVKTETQWEKFNTQPKKKNIQSTLEKDLGCTCAWKSSLFVQKRQSKYSLLILCIKLKQSVEQNKLVFILIIKLEFIKQGRQLLSSSKFSNMKLDCFSL